MKRGKLGSDRGNKRKSIKKNLLNSFNNMVKKNSRKRVIVSGVIVSVLSFSCVWYFQSKSALASNREIYKSLEITNKAEEVKTVTAYDKLIDGEDINILILGDENYLGDVILKEDITSFIENTYNSKVKLTNLSEDNVGRTLYKKTESARKRCHTLRVLGFRHGTAACFMRHYGASNKADTVHAAGGLPSRRHANVPFGRCGYRCR